MYVRIKGEVITNATGEPVKFPSGTKPESLFAALLPNNPSLTLSDVEVIGGKQAGLDSPEKMTRLGVPKDAQEEYLELVRVWQKQSEAISEFLKKHSIEYVYEGIETGVIVGSGIYIQNPDSVPAAIIERLKK